MAVVTGQAGEDETPNVVETLVNELCAVRAELATAQGDLYEQGEDLVKARNQVAYRDRKITELTAERDETWKELNRQQAARIGEAATRARLAGERDRARDVAVTLEQELAGYDARVETALKQVMRTADMVDARDRASFILAEWQNPDPDPFGVPQSVSPSDVRD